MTSSQPATDQIINLVANVITPLFTVGRTMVMPFDKNRHENDGEHSLALSILACALAEKLDSSLDTGKIAKYAAVHDIVHIHSGDISVWEPVEAQRQHATDEELAADQILKDFPMFPWIIRTYNEYELRDTPEKRFVHALDKIYPHILILTGNHHPVKPSWEAYSRREKIVRTEIALSSALLPLFDDLCMKFRQNSHFFSTPIPPNEQNHRD